MLRTTESESLEGSSSYQGRWTKQEHHLFIQALSLYGKNWKLVENHVGTRSSSQLRSHAQKFFNRIERELDVSITAMKAHELKDFFKRKNSEFKSLKPAHSPMKQTPSKRVMREVQCHSQPLAQVESTAQQLEVKAVQPPNDYRLQLLEIELQHLAEQRNWLIGLYNTITRLNTEQTPNNSRDQPDPTTENTTTKY